MRAKASEEEEKIETAKVQKDRTRVQTALRDAEKSAKKASSESKGVAGKLAQSDADVDQEKVKSRCCMMVNR